MTMAGQIPWSKDDVKQLRRTIQQFTNRLVTQELLTCAIRAKCEFASKCNEKDGRHYKFTFKTIGKNHLLPTA